jgi:hypothetical protein
MPEAFKLHTPLRLAFEIREYARKTGRTISDTLLGAVERGLGTVPAEMPEGIVDRVERGGKGAKSVAAYLSPPLAKAITQLAAEERRSSSWVMRLLIREGLRARGLLPPSTNNAADTGAVAD